MLRPAACVARAQVNVLRSASLAVVAEAKSLEQDPAAGVTAPAPRSTTATEAVIAVGNPKQLPTTVSPSRLSR